MRAKRRRSRPTRQPAAPAQAARAWGAGHRRPLRQPRAEPGSRRARAAVGRQLRPVHPPDGRAAVGRAAVRRGHPRLLNGSDYPLPAINVLVQTRIPKDRGFITSAERKALNELDQHNPLMFDFVLKRTVRLRRDGVAYRLSPEVFIHRDVFPRLLPFGSRDAGGCERPALSRAAWVVRAQTDPSPGSAFFAPTASSLERGVDGSSQPRRRALPQPCEHPLGGEHTEVVRLFEQRQPAQVRVREVQ